MADSPVVQKRVDNDRAHRKGLIEFRKFENDNGELTPHGWNEAMNELGLNAQFGNRFDLVVVVTLTRVGPSTKTSLWNGGIAKGLVCTRTCWLKRRNINLDHVTDMQMDNVSDIIL